MSTIGNGVCEIGNYAIVSLIFLRGNRRQEKGGGSVTSYQ